MGEMKISNATSSNLTDNLDDVTPDALSLDGVTGLDETEYQCTEASTYLGYYKTVPECKIATDTLSRFTIGDGFIASPQVTSILDNIKGWGHDTFDDILENLDRCCSIYGDAYAEVIRDPKTDILINLKPLDPATMKIIVDKKGMIKRYEQTTKTGKSPPVKFQPKDILHLTNKRLGDEIHGISDYQAIEELIKANYENFMDVKQLMHRHVKPIMAFKLDTDDQTKINAFIAKMDDVINKGENIYIPKDTVEFELVTVPSSATLSPFQWREHIRNYFYQVVGIPQILMGGASEFTESTAKIAYLSFEQTVKQRQRYLITQVWNQLYLKIDLDFPASLQNEMLSDESKDSGQMGFQKSEIGIANTEGGANG